MNKFLEENGFYPVQNGCQKEYNLVGMFVGVGQVPFGTVSQHFPHEGKFWLTVEEKKDKFVVSLTTGQDREEQTKEISEYELVSLLLRWESQLKQKNIL